MKTQTTKSTEGKRAVIYLRVSTEEQVDNFSLETQEDICRKEAEKRGYKIIDIFREEGRSAKSIAGRPVLINLLEYCRKNKEKISAVFVYRLDRISRQTSDYLAIRKRLAEKDVQIISASEPTGESPTEKLVETILAGFAQLDNDIRSERAKNGLRARFKAGLISGKAPLGYVLVNGYAVKDPQTWDRVKRAWDLMATGNKSLGDIAALMNEWGLVEVHGNKEFKLRKQTVQRIFSNKFYMGKIVSKKYPEEVNGQHIPMVSEEHYYKVQAIIQGRTVTSFELQKREADRNAEFPLRRLVKCGVCNIGLTAAWTKGRNNYFPYYRCSGKCTKSIRKETLETSLVELLKRITPSEDALNIFISQAIKVYNERAGRLRKIRDESENEIKKLQEFRRHLVEKNLSGVYSDEIFKEQNAIIEEKMMRAQIAKDDTIYEKYNIQEVTNFMRTMLADLGETFKRSNQLQSKVLLGSIFPSGLTWQYSGTLNTEISPLYKAISETRGGDFALGAEKETRTPDLLLGKETLYQLSYFRDRYTLLYQIILNCLVPRVGVGPTLPVFQTGALTTSATSA